MVYFESLGGRLKNQFENGRAAIRLRAEILITLRCKAFHAPHFFGFNAVPDRPAFHRHAVGTRIKSGKAFIHAVANLDPFTTPNDF